MLPLISFQDWRENTNSIFCSEAVQNLKAVRGNSLFSPMEPVVNGFCTAQKTQPEAFSMADLRSASLCQFPSTSQAWENPAPVNERLRKNVSPHGARVISKRSWRSGEEALIAPLTGEFPQVGTVAYSPAQKNGGGRFLPGCRIPGSLGQMGELLRTELRKTQTLTQRR